MSKKTQKKINKKETSYVVVKEEKSKVEKIVTYVIYGVVVVLITLVIALSINCNGDAGRIAKKYSSLDIDNVFEYIKFDELNEKIENGETFYVLLISTQLDDADYYIFCVNQIVKMMQSENIEGIDKIYLFDTYDLEDEEIKFFKNVKYNILKSPNLLYYDNTNSLDTKSVVESSTVFYDVEEYYNNQYYLIIDYFKDIYTEEE